MSMVLTEEQAMLKEAAHGFLHDAAPISQLRRLRDQAAPDGFDRATWKAMADMGWTGVLVPEEHGGSGLGFVSAGVIAEEMGRTLTASPYLTTAVVGAAALQRFGSQHQKSQWLPAIAAGEAIMALAVDEAARHAPARVATCAERAGNGFRLNGRKRFVAEGGAADVFIVSARTSGAESDAAGITLFLVPRGTQGVVAERQAMADSRGWAAVTLENVELTADAVLGEVDAGSSALEAILDAGRAGLAAEMAGSAQECLARSVAYLGQRKQFGRTLASFQALQHRAAHLYSEIELGRSIVLKALQALDGGSPSAPLYAAAAKAKLGQVAQLAAREAIQLHGGIGMTDELDIGFFLKRVRTADALFGDAAWHVDRFARLRGY
jgi:alkylation response protein AidB-like acyl-CoA dehydrogenase